MVKRGQISFEYLVIMGFVTLVLAGLLGLAFFYGTSVQDKIRLTQVTNYGNKIISTVESVSYAGEPSKATIEVYLPEEVEEVTIYDRDLLISIRTSTGLNKLVFTSKVSMEGSLQNVQGLKNIQISAGLDKVSILQV